MGVMDRSIGKGDRKLTLNEGKVELFGKVLVNEGDGSSRVDHSIDGEE
jgi:hypothetical protein